MSNSVKNIMIVGVGGQGTLLASKLLGYVLMQQGYDVKVSEVHGMSQRGGSVVTYVRFGDKVYSPVIDKGEADYILSFEKLEALRWIEYLKIIILGIVEGITEWLPISSTGHMILLNEIMPLKVSDAFYSMFEVVIQLGAIMAVVVLYFNKLNPFSKRKSAKQKRNTINLWCKIVVACLPAAVIGLFFDDMCSKTLSGQVL